MKKLLAALLLAFCFSLFSQVSYSQTVPYTPEKGSPERKAILDAVRKYRNAPNELYTPYGFNVMQGWAVVAARDPNDPDVDTEAFEYLLRKTGGSWRVVDHISQVEGSDYDKEVKRIRKRFPALPSAVLVMKVE